MGAEDKDVRLLDQTIARINLAICWGKTYRRPGDPACDVLCHLPGQMFVLVSNGEATQISAEAARRMKRRWAAALQGTPFDDWDVPAPSEATVRPRLELPRHAQTSGVWIGQPREPVVVLGVRKDPLTVKQHLVFKALWEAGLEGLTWDELIRRSGCGGARNCIYTVRGGPSNSRPLDREWNLVIREAGSAHGQRLHLRDPGWTADAA